MKKYALWLILVVVGVPILRAQDFPRGEIIDDVQSRADASQHYTLYLPSYFTTDHQWPVIFGFDPGGRGRTAVERYQEAAEKYGYIAGSTNARNGPWML
jgi:hypothetical protein